MTTLVAGEREGAFIATKEHRRFVEFATAVRKHRYAHWDLAESLIEGWGVAEAVDAGVQAALARPRTVFHTPTVTGTLRDLRDTMANSLVIVSNRIEDELHAHGVKVPRRDRHRLVEMVIIDEAERMPTSALELVRDIFDRTGMGVILIGMPGMEKRLSRYPQLYSRVGFAHHYRRLQGDELTFVLTRHWRRLGLALDDADFTDAQAISSIARITGGNFRLLNRLFVQIGRIL